jgi:site-specific recombinase XerD
LPIERRASPNTCDSYAHAFRLLFEYASACIKLPPSQLQLEQLDAPLIVNFLNHLETSRGNGAGSRNIRRAAIKSFMHYLEYRVPSALEQIQRILAIPAKKTDTRRVTQHRGGGLHLALLTSHLQLVRRTCRAASPRLIVSTP